MGAKRYRSKRVAHPAAFRAAGSHLIELVLAVGLSGFLTAVLGSSIGELIRQSSITQNQLVASTIAQETIDRLRATRFDLLPPTGGSMVVNLSSTGSTGTDQTLDRPLMIDAKNLTWKGAPATGQIPVNSFSGTVELKLEEFQDADGLDADAKSVDVTIRWSDSSGSAHKLTRHAVLHRYGITRNAI